MTMDIPKAYDPKKAEHHYERWESSGFFAPEINKDEKAETFSIVIPPPNVTGSLHMGHALQHTLMDTLTRWKRMCGYRTLFLVGVDHAGISTQLMVTRQLKKDEHKTPQDIGREAFIEKVWKWKNNYGNVITEQIRREGLSVDWSRERFTMDEDLSKAVREVFVRLYEEGSIYRGTRIVNWCPRDKTVLSDLEVKEEKAKDGKLYYLRYPFAKQPENGVRVPWVVVATTRPETMLGDTAVAVNPDDDRYADLIGKVIELPLADRKIMIIADEYVEPEFGTGAVKITPAHDANDWEIGERHGLEKLVVMNDDATMNESAGAEFAGLDRFAAREKVIEKFQTLGLLEKIEDYDATLPRCERCKTIVEPLLSEQWFVKMDDMRDRALALMNDEGFPRFFPEVPHKKVYTTWLENLRDWTISRQLWWGHQIPAWYDADGNVFVARTEEDAYEQAGTKDLERDEDVLDTWFSSALWPFSTLGWTGEESTKNEPDLEEFYPTDVLVTGRDIIFLWVSRMVMSGLKFVGERPFDDVIIHGTVLDKNGQRMSKTKNNGIDPLEVFEKFGVDATRMTLAGSATGVDFAWRDEKVENFRNFANKIWNATRFCLINVPEQSVNAAPADSLADRWIISRLNRTAIEVNRSLGKYEFHTAVSLLYHFFWDDFCDWYIELKKDEITSGDTAASALILEILEQALRLLHPFMPFITEELWLKLPGTSSEMHHPAYAESERSIMLASFPLGDVTKIDEGAENEMNSIIEVIKKIRNIRAEMNIPPSVLFTIHIAAAESVRASLRVNEARILKLARAKSIALSEKLDAPRASAKAVTSNAEIAIPLEGLIDFDKERSRLSGQIAKLGEELGRLNGQLSNVNFVEKAPKEKVEELRQRKAEIEQQLRSLQGNIESLG